MFSGCSSLTSIVLPSSIVEIYGNTFSGCSSLVSVTGSTLSKFGAYAFDDCSSLREITLSNEKPAYPLDDNRIGVYAFDGCIGLTDVYFEETQQEWQEIVIASGNTALTQATIHYEYSSI